ncbi:MAG: hypothetical protein WDN08_04920 [Rhizomicrobium sp.]
MDMRKIVLAGAVALCSAQPALADTWTGVYGNTITSTYADGRVVKVYVESDHTYSIVLPDGAKLKGTWADGGGQSCFTLTDPPPPPDAKPSCFALKEYKVGDTFAGEDATGKYTGVISAGR